MKISTVVITNKEINAIGRCLKSADFSDEVVIIQDKAQSSPLRQGFAGQAKIKIFQRNLNGDFSAQRNFGMEKAVNDWVLFVDDDEEVAEELKNEIRDLLFVNRKNPNNPALPAGRQYPITDNVAFYIKRRDFFWGKELKHGEVMKIRNQGLIRLVKKNSGRWQGKVHEEFVIHNSEFRIARLNNYLNHYPHPTLKEFIGKINFYSSLRAEELYQSGKKFYLYGAISLPFFKFILNYFIYGGFLDGPPGFAYAFLMSFHSYLVRAKLFKLYYAG